MDPFTLALLGTGAVVGGAQAISGAFKSKEEKANLEEIERLRRLRAQGKFGLSGKEEQVFSTRYLDPVRASAAADQRRNEARLTAMGTSSGAQLANLREERATSVGQAQQAAAGAMREADVAKQLSQKAELSQREAAAEDRKAYRKEEVFSGLGQIANAVGTAAGTVPEAFRMAGVAGAPIRDPQALGTYLGTIGVPQESIDLVQKIPRNQITTILNDVENGVLTSPAHLAMKQALEYDAMYRANAALSLGSSLGYGG